MCRGWYEANSACVYFLLLAVYTVFSGAGYTVKEDSVLEIPILLYGMQYDVMRQLPSYVYPL